jgi:hypothetical protein
MSTDQLELLLATSLHENDSQAVDVPGGRSALRERIEQDQRLGRRRALIGIAAAVVAVVVTTSLLLTGALREERAVPVHPAPPKVVLSPSGLPIGLLEGLHDGTGHLRLLVRILVRADGSGQFSSYGGSSSGVAFDVTLRPDGPGRATVAYDNPALADPEVVTLSFTLRDRTVTIGKVDTPGNGIISKATARSIAGSTLRILRPPPSGRL